MKRQQRTASELPSPDPALISKPSRTRGQFGLGFVQDARQDHDLCGPRIAVRLYGVLHTSQLTGVQRHRRDAYPHISRRVNESNGQHYATISEVSTFQSPWEYTGTDTDHIRPQEQGQMDVSSMVSMAKVTVD